MQLVRASLAAIREIRGVIPSARFAQVEPIFHVIADPDRPEEATAAEAYRLAQYQSWDLLSGRLMPELGGRPEDLDVIGVNYYPWNQWIYRGETEPGATIGPEHEGYRPFRLMLRENFDRYRRPLFVAETGTEGGRPPGLAPRRRRRGPRRPGRRGRRRRPLPLPDRRLPRLGRRPPLPQRALGPRRRVRAPPDLRPLADELARQRPRFEATRHRPDIDGARPRRPGEARRA